VTETPDGEAGQEPEVTDLAFDRGRLSSPLADKADDLDALRAAVVDAAGVSGGLWLSYLFVLFYFLVAAGGVTHKDLFLENPVKLPFLNVDLPLQGFFWLGPLIFLIVHTYVLLHFVVLAGKVRAYDTALSDQVTAFEARASLRRQLPTNIFVQFLAGPREVRLGILGGLLWMVAVISLVIGPVILLLFFELKFLPYHEEWITWVQRLTVAADLLLLWKFWPLITSRAVDTESGQAFGWRRPGWFSAELMRFVLMALGVLLAVGVPIVTTFPGETIDPLIPRTMTTLAGATEAFPVLTWARKALVEGEVNAASRRPVSPFSNRLVLPGLDVIDHAKFDSDAKFDAVRETVSLRYRHLEGAVLTGAGLRKADFTAAFLRDARLDQADLRDANFGAAGQPVQYGSIFVGIRAKLDGASLYHASLQGASFYFASLQGALLDGALLQGALLDRALLQGATLNLASLQGASLNYASLQGASLDSAMLQGASLDFASLQGASMNYASLQGASLRYAGLEGASFNYSFVWRTDARTAGFDRTDVTNIDTMLSGSCGPHSTCTWDSKSFHDLRAAVMTTIPNDEARQSALARIDTIANPDQPFATEREIETKWTDLRDQPFPPDAIATERVRVLRLVGCDAHDAPYIVTGMARTLRNADPSARSAQGLFTGDIALGAFGVFPWDFAGDAARAFLDPACKGANGISAETVETLKFIAASIPTKPPAE